MQKQVRYTVEIIFHSNGNTLRENIKTDEKTIGNANSWKTLIDHTVYSASLTDNTNGKVVVWK